MSNAGAMLQFYDVHNDRHLSSLHIKSFNFVSRVNDELLNTSIVSLFDFSHDGSVLATVDKRRQHKHVSDTSLQFWDRRRNGGVGEYVLNSRLDNPHNDGIALLLFHPSKSIAVTCGKDGVFKVWAKTGREEHVSIALDTHMKTKGVNTTEGKDVAESTKWSCRSSGYYRKGCVITAAAFSPDGSLLALAYDSVISLWDISLTALVHTLAHPSSSHIKALSFLPNNNYLLSTLDSGLSVWNLLTSSISWSIVAKVKCTSINKIQQSQFAVAVSGSSLSVTGDSLLLFDVASPVPMLSWKLPNNTTIESVVYKSNGDAEATEASFVILTSESELLQFGPVSNSEVDEIDGKSTLLSTHSISDVLRKDLIVSNTPSIFEQVFGISNSRLPAVGSSPVDVISKVVNSSSHAEKVRMQLDAPVHIMPSPGALLTALANTITKAPNTTSTDMKQNVVKGGENTKAQLIHSSNAVHEANATSMMKLMDGKDEMVDVVESAVVAANNATVEVRNGNKLESSSSVELTTFNQSMTSFFQCAFRSPPGQVSDGEMERLKKGNEAGDNGVNNAVGCSAGKRKRATSPVKVITAEGSSPYRPSPKSTVKETRNSTVKKGVETPASKKMKTIAVTTGKKLLTGRKT